MMSQSDYLIGIDARRPDSDAPQDRCRGYEMAGAAHATPDELFYSASPADIVKAGRAVPQASCNEGPRSRFPSSIFFDAALRNLDRWVRFGIAPPHADPILVSGSPPAPVLDAFGNVQGGLRSPYLDVPKSMCRELNWPVVLQHRRARGAVQRAQLAELYPNHGDYVSKATHDTVRLVAERFLTVADGIRLIREAARANVPYRRLIPRG